MSFFSSRDSSCAGPDCITIPVRLVAFQSASGASERSSRLTRPPYSPIEYWASEGGHLVKPRTRVRPSPYLLRVRVRKVVLFIRDDKVGDSEEIARFSSPVVRCLIFALFSGKIPFLPPRESRVCFISAGADRPYRLEKQTYEKNFCVTSVVLKWALSADQSTNKQVSIIYFYQ